MPTGYRTAPHDSIPANADAKRARTEIGWCEDAIAVGGIAKVSNVLALARWRAVLPVLEAEDAQHVNR